jgi:hypothetical protein
MGRHPKLDKKTKRRSPPARNPENRENQLIDLAYDLAEERLLDKTASAQEIVHFLKLGTARAQLEKKKLEAETLLLESKKEAVDSSKRSDAKYQEALAAFRVYNGLSPEEDDSNE